MKNLFGYSAFICTLIVLLSSCSAYKSQGRKNFETDSDGRTAGELNVQSIADTMSPENHVYLETESQNQKKYFTFSKAELLNAQCTELSAELPVICISGQVYTLLSAKLIEP
jgi:hypothetical protein